MNGFRGYSESLAGKIAWARDHGGFSDRLGRSLMRIWDHQIMDEVSRELIDGEIRPLLKRSAAGELPPFKITQVTRGEYILGRDSYGREVRWQKHWIPQGTLIVATTGGGKTSLLVTIVLQWAREGCACWLSESYKTNLRHLRPLLGRVGVELVVIQPECWKWNPLQADGNLLTYFARIRDLCTRRLDLGQRGGNLLAQALFDLYRRFGNWEGRRDAWPTPFDACEYVRSTPGLNPSARDAVLDRLIDLCLSVTPRCGAYRLAWRPSDLARYSIVFELQKAGETVSRVFQESLLFSVFQKAVEDGVLNAELRHFIAFDDSQRLFDVSSTAALGGSVTPLDELAGTVRGMGIGFCPIVQTSLGLSPRLQVNLNNKFIGQLACHEDWSALGADLSLSSEQIHWAKLNLLPGWFIGQFAGGDRREPFLFHAPRQPLTEHVDDAEAKASVAGLEDLPNVFAEEFAHWEPYLRAEIHSEEKASEPQPLSDPEIRFLRAIIEQPGQPSSTYCRLAGMSGQRAVQVREQLVGRGLIREHALATGGRGRTAIVLEPLEPAFEAIRQAAT